MFVCSRVRTLRVGVFVFVFVFMFEFVFMFVMEECFSSPHSMGIDESNKIAEAPSRSRQPGLTSATLKSEAVRCRVK